MSGDATRKPRVLVIDDQALVARAIGRVLKECDVELCVSGEAALERLAAQPRPDVVLCDLRLPGLSGIEVHARVAASDPAMAERFVFVTGEPPELNEAPLPPGVPLLRKPPSPEELRQAVRDRMS
jgi:CheY-like chemotaxis protein